MEGIGTYLLVKLRYLMLRAVLKRGHLGSRR